MADAAPWNLRATTQQPTIIVSACIYIPIKIRGFDMPLMSIYIYQSYIYKYCRYRLHMLVPETTGGEHEPVQLMYIHIYICTVCVCIYIYICMYIYIYVLVTEPVGMAIAHINLYINIYIYIYVYIDCQYSRHQQWKTNGGRP